MVLASSNLSIWVEIPDSDPSSWPSTGSPPYRKSTAFSSLTTKQEIITGRPMLLNEAYIESNAGTPYRIAIRVKPHWRNVGIQLIIDGVEQGNYISFNRFLSHETRIGGRRIGKNSVKGFVFSKLRIEDGHGNYKFDEGAHCRGGYINANIKMGDIAPIEFMVGKNAAGSIRVNLYRVGKIEKGGMCQGNGDWNPCTAVDDIGQLKMRAGVESVTTLGLSVKCSTASTMHAEFPEKYPFESFVLRYRPRDALASENLLIVKQTGIRRLVNYITDFFVNPRAPKGYSNKTIAGEKKTFSI